MEGYSAGVTLDLVMVADQSYVHMNHLIVMESATHTQMKVVIVSPKMVTRTGSLTRKVDGSQLQNWKFGKSQR